MEYKWSDDGYMATLTIAGTTKDLGINDLVTITEEKRMDVGEYTPPALSGYTPGGLARIISRRAEKGVGGYDLMDGRDQAFAFDYTGSGKLDHLFFFRPGSDRFSIVTYKQLQFLKVYSGSDADPKAPGDAIRPSMFQKYGNLRGFAFDPFSYRRLDYVAFYAPGQRWFVVGKKKPRDADGNDWYLGGYAETATCDMSDPNDKAFAFDYSGEGFLDHVVVYRPGSGRIWILKVSSDNFHYEEKWASQKGIGGFELTDPRDLGLAFDYERRGRLDHLLFYRPGTGIVCIIKKVGD
jgi:hypothetical protein